MIIKSMSRKEGSYRQLYDYMRHGANRKDDKYKLSHNCYGRKREDIINEFEDLGKLLTKRKNGVYLYHEIISISRSKTLSEDKQKEILAEIVRKYVQDRAANNLVCGYMHDEKDNNLHFHLMISSNEVGKSKRHSLRKKQFDTIKSDLEKRVLENHPELEQKQLISKKNSYKDDKEAFKDALQSIFSISQSRDQLHQHLKDHNFAYKIRGNTITFINEETKKRHRLKTLGILEDYEKMVQGFEVNNQKANTEKKAAHEKSQDDPTDNTKTTAKEWIFGDFTERDQRIEEEKRKEKKAKYKEQDKADAKVKAKSEQTVKEKIAESAKEFGMGDFSARDARARKEASEERLKKWHEKKQQIAKDKNKSKKK